MMDSQGVNVLVLGLGSSGVAAANMLSKLQASVTVYDDNVKSQEFVNTDNLDYIDLCVVSPGISTDHRVLSDCRRKKIPIMSELELGTSYMNSDIIAITGTNGKTTTTLLVTELLKESGINAVAMGNIGDPVSNYALTLNESNVAVIEVSSFQLEHTNYFAPKIAAITNIAPDHLDRHKDYGSYVNCKLSIFNHIKSDGRSVINYDDAILRELSLSLNGKKTFFSTKYKVQGCYLNHDNIYYDGYVCSLDDLAMCEPHNIENILCALSICMPLNIPKDVVRNVLMQFKPPDYRMSHRGVHNGKRYINDSKSTNIHSCISACNAMVGDTVLILGGSDKGEDFNDLFVKLPKNIKYILVSGDNSERILECAHKCNYLAIEQLENLEYCIERTKSLDVINVLFSPASASFDRYKDYKARGAAFDSLL